MSSDMGIYALVGNQLFLFMLYAKIGKVLQNSK